MAKETKKENVVESTELSYDTKTLITVITLVTVYPVGLILTFVWMKWNKLIKFFVTLPVLMMVLVPIFILIVMLAVGMKLISEPREHFYKYDSIKDFSDETRNEMIISPTERLLPTISVVKR